VYFIFVLLLVHEIDLLYRTFLVVLAALILVATRAMYTAYLLRSGERKGIGMKNMGSFLGLLLVRSFDRAGRVYQAMKNRGFDGVYHTGVVRPLRLSDGIFAVGTCIAAVFFRLFNTGDFLGGLLAGLGGG
jgi:cobalt/nickel transport system permease protein